VLALAAATLALWLILGAVWFRGMSRVPHLRALGSRVRPDLPTLTVVIPALNEEATIEGGLTTVLAQDYPGLEVIVLNDRSTDRTGEILEGLQRHHPNLGIVHLTRLPEGWLGKNHALLLGARAARGEWLLFTDADVHFAPGALRAAVTFALDERLDHLAALPHLTAKSPPLKAFVAVFSLLFSLYSGLWRVAQPNSASHVGIGAFNLLKRAAYEAVGGHRPIALRPDDDMMLGKLIKRAGFRQGVVVAADLLAVEWYTGVREAVRGLRKNAFAGFGYAPARLVGAVAGLLVTHAFPFVAVFVTAGPARGLYLLVLLVIALVYAYNARFSKVPARYALLHPLGVAILGYAMVASMVRALWQGGITWRGTFYPLEQLRKNRV
jgi:glycosyltransferase involved in cell wall biosynthesis